MGFIKRGLRVRPVAIAGVSVLLFGIVAALWFYHRDEENVSIASKEPLPDLNKTKASAESGDAQAANTLGEIYAAGKQARQNYSEAVKWYRKAADKGLARAQYNLGVLYEIGQSVPHDEAEAASWYRKAAEQGNADAQYNLAAMYGLGRGVPLDGGEALKWYHRAAEQGDPLACYNLAERYERGKGVVQDLVEAYKWHSLAAQRGFKDGAIARDKLKRMLTSAQHREADKRIQEFRAKYPGNVQPKGG